MGITIRVRVQPGASRDEVMGWEGDTLRLRLRARAVEGKANSALMDFLASCLGLRPYQVNLAPRGTVPREAGGDRSALPRRGDLPPGVRGFGNVERVPVPHRPAGAGDRPGNGSGGPRSSER